MEVEKFFVKKVIELAELDEYLEEELEHAGYGGVEIGRIPTGTRVTLYVERPGAVIGKKGRTIQELTDELAQRFGMENPQVEVVGIEKPELNAQIMAKRIAFALERGSRVRSIGHAFLRRIMEAGARGAEIVISGKIVGERARRVRFYQGYLSKAGEPAEKLVSRGYAYAKLPPGVVGVKVRIMPPVPTPDEIRIGPEEPEGEALRVTETGGEPEEKVEGKDGGAEGG